MDNQGDLFGGWTDPTTQPLAVDGWTGSAVFSPCGKYRYELHREWPDGDGHALVVMLNPSDANAQANDPTVQRVCGFVRAARLRRLTVVNMFAFITPYPSVMITAINDGVDPVGAPENDARIAALAEKFTIIVAAWGACSEAPQLAKARARGLCLVDGPLVGRDLHALRLTKDGAPGHPLYLPRTCRFEPYSRADLERWCAGKAV